MSIKNEIDSFLDFVIDIPETKGYWLIRTNSGFFYDDFKDANIVGISHNQIKLSSIEQISKKYGNEKKRTVKEFKEIIKRVDKEANHIELLSENAISIAANQIYRFVFEVKKGDIVIIPSENSETILIGEVTKSYISSKTLKTSDNTPIILLKEVRWLKEVNRRKLDPNLYKIFFAHQAINDIKDYESPIERTINDLYILNNEAHLIINIGKQEDIPASELFGLGYHILSEIDGFAKFYNLDISSSDFDVSINLNSKGTIDLKSKVKKGIPLAALILFICGGGLTSKNFNLSTGGLPTLIDAYSRYKDAEGDRKMKDDLFAKYKDSLEVKDSQDFINLLKQFSKNQDLPK